jgi:hypothetical protein
MTTDPTEIDIETEIDTDTVAPDGDPYRALAVAVLRNAADDAQRGRTEAQEFLSGAQHSAALLQALGSPACGPGRPLLVS